MSVPYFWTQSAFKSAALYRLAGIWALLLIFLLLRQFSVRGRVRHRIYGVIAIAGLIQTLLAFWQIEYPTSAGESLGYSFTAASGRPIGSLLQVNLLGSFLASALLCALLLAMTLPSTVKSRFYWVSVLVLSAGLVMTQSRSAWLGATMGGGILLLYSRIHWRSKSFAVLLLCSGVVAGNIALVERMPLITPAAVKTADARPSGTNERLIWNRRQSGNERLTMFEGALAMIKEKPLSGYGLATFEVEFPRALERNNIANPFTVTVKYPHNEILYVWAEGGVVALIGLTMWLYGVLLPFRTSWNRTTVLKGALLLPLIVHLLTEFPLYLSAVHGVLMIILLWLALPVAKRSKASHPVMGKCSAFILSGIAVLSFTGVIFSTTGLQSAIKIRSAEQLQIMDLSSLDEVSNVLAQHDKLLFDKAIASLMLFNSSRDSSWLLRFQEQAGEWLSLHNDANLTVTMMQIAAAEKNDNEVQRWRHRGCLSYAKDPRFKCQFIH